MREWEREVGGRLHGMRLPPGQRCEVVRELASHFAEAAEELESAGCSPEEAGKRVLGEVTDWKRLACRIESAKGEDMRERDRKVLLPGTAVFMVSALMQAALLQFGIVPLFYFLPSAGFYLKVPVVWLCTLPFCAALGAGWSRKWGGNNWHRVLAACFPTIATFGIFLFAGAVGVTIAAIKGMGLSTGGTPAGYALGLLNDFVIPGAALFLGSLPFLDWRGGRRNLEQAVSAGS